MVKKEELQKELEHLSAIIGTERARMMSLLEEENDYLRNVISRLLKLIETLSVPKDSPGVTHYHYYAEPDKKKGNTLKIIDLSREEQIDPIYNPNYKIPDSTSD